MSLHALLQLCRIPNVFTAISNVLAGIVLARGGTVEASDFRVIGSSALLYIAGMVFNDYFDREVDAIERPSRPIPSGRVGAGFALALGLALVGAAFLLLRPLGSTVCGAGLALALVILAYDGGLKNTPMGVPNMGLCRALNVILGFSVVPWPVSWMWVLPVGLGFYTAVITYLARDEVVGVALERSRAGARMMGVLFLVFVVFIAALTPGQTASSFMVVAPFLLVLAVRGARSFSPLLRNASGPTVGRAIGGGILLMPAIDATVLACAGYIVWAVLVLVLTLPAMALKRWYYMT